MIRVFPRKTKWTPTDELVFVGDPPLIRPPEQPVHVSVAFTWDIAEGRRLAAAWLVHYPNVWIGGPAFGMHNWYVPTGTGIPGTTYFQPGVYIKHGVTFTSRGCPKHCPWCLVPEREGRLREIPIVPGNIVQDNNFLACSQGHCEAVYHMLMGQTAVQFKGGLDIDYLTPWHVDRLKALPSLDELWVACDTQAGLGRLDKAADLLAGFSIEKRRCYVLIGFGDDTPAEAEARCEAIYAKGFLPFVQYYRPREAERGAQGKWNPVIRKWSRPGGYRHEPKEVEAPLWKT